MEAKEQMITGGSEPQLGDVNAAAALLHVPKTWLYERTRRNAIPADVMLRIGKYVRFDLTQLLAWVQAGCPERQ